MERKVNITSRIPGAEIHYELDGSDPTIDSPLYTGPVTITESCQVRARAFKFGMAYSDVAAVNVTMPQKLQAPTLTLSRSNEVVNGTIGNTVSGATYVYKIGSAPISQSDGTVISGTTFSFTNSSALTVYVRGFYPGYEMSDPVGSSVAQYVPKLQTPTLSLSRSGSTVSGTVGNMVSGATYRYGINSIPSSETDGSAVSSSGTFSFSNSSALTVYVRGFMSGYTMSDAASASVSAYTPPKCATPTISQSGNTVTFSCSTSGATIHYSGCGKSGTCSSGGSVTISQSGTMSAYATASGYSTSSTATKYCSYSQPSLPTPTIRMETSHASYFEDVYYKFYISNFSSFPSGTSFSVSGSVTSTLVSTEGFPLTKSIGSVTPTSSNGGQVGQVSFDSPSYLQSWSITVTASKSGYKSSTGSASG